MRFILTSPSFSLFILDLKLIEDCFTYMTFCFFDFSICFSRMPTFDILFMSISPNGLKLSFKPTTLSLFTSIGDSRFFSFLFLVNLSLLSVAGTILYVFFKLIVNYDSEPIELNGFAISIKLLPAPFCFLFVV